MRISATTSILDQTGGMTAVAHAIGALQRDLVRVLGSTPTAASTVAPDQIRLKVETIGRDEAFCIDVQRADNCITISGNDELGVVFGIYRICEEFLGIDPYWFWTDLPTIPRDYIDVPEGVFESDQPAIRFRGWFTNGEDCLVGWHDDMKISLKTWAAIFETMLRAGFNMVIPGTGIETRAPQLTLAAQMGLWINQHHAEPLGAPMLSSVHPGICPRYPEDMDKFEQTYRDAIAANKGRKVVWALGFRGQGDHAFYSEDPRHDTPEKQGRVISEVISLQKAMVSRMHDGKSHFMHNLYGESATLYKAGHLKLDDDIIRVWGDNGFGAMRVRRVGIGHGETHESSMPPQSDRGKPYGVYYHVNFHDLEISNQVVPLVAPELIVDQFDAMHSAAGPAEFLMLNVGNIRPHIVDIALIGKMAGTPASEYPLGRAFANAHYRNYAARYFPQAADKCEAILKDYFAAPFSFGEYPDQKAGEQVYHHTLRWGIKAVLKNLDEWPHTGFASDMPPQRDERFKRMLDLVEASIPRWQDLLQRARDAAANYPQRHYFRDTLLMHCAYMCFSAQGYVQGLRALLAYSAGDFKQAFVMFALAKKNMQAALEALLDTQHGKWRNFCRGEWLTGTRETIRYLDAMQGVCRIVGETGHRDRWIIQATGLSKVPMNVIAQASADYDKLAAALLQAQAQPPKNDFTCLI